MPLNVPELDQNSLIPAIPRLPNYANPVYGVATICHQVRWLL